MPICLASYVLFLIIMVGYVCKAETAYDKFSGIFCIVVATILIVFIVVGLNILSNIVTFDIQNKIIKRKGLLYGRKKTICFDDVLVVKTMRFDLENDYLVLFEKKYDCKLDELIKFNDNWKNRKYINELGFRIENSDLLHFDETYNRKIDFQIIFSLNKQKRYGENYNELKDIFYNGADPTSEQGKEFYKLLSGFNVLRKQLDKNSIKEVCSFMLIDIKDSSIKKISKYFKPQKDLKVKIGLFVMYALRKNIFGDYTNELTALIVDALLIQNKFVPIIFEHSIFNFLKSKVPVINSVSNFVDGVFINYSKSKRYFFGYGDNLSKNKIINDILLNKDELKDLGAEAIWLFGSFANDSFDECSDINVFVSEKNGNSLEIRSFLNNLFHRDIDLQIEEQVQLDEYIVAKNERILIYDERY